MYLSKINRYNYILTNTFYMKKIVFSLMICFLVACSGVSKEALADKVKNDIDVEFSKRATESGITYTIDNLDLVHKSGNEYSGILKTTEDGAEFTYQVDVTVDGDTYMWKIVE